MTLRDTWFPILLGKDLAAGQVVAAKIFGDPVALFREEGGRVRCVLDLCPHQASPLSAGKVRGGAIECVFHGWRFRGEDGRCDHIPLAVEPKIPPAAQCRVYPVVERDGLVWIWPGAPERAVVDEARVTRRPYDHEVLLTYVIPFPSSDAVAIETGFDPAHFYHLHEKSLRLWRPAARSLTPRPVQSLPSGFSARFDADPDGRGDFYQLHFYPPGPLTVLIHRGVGILPLSVEVLLTIYVTPIDRKESAVTLVVSSNSVPAPIAPVIKAVLRTLLPRVFEEDKWIAGRIQDNLDRGAPSIAAATPLDGFWLRYHKWRASVEHEDLWFQGFGAARGQRERPSQGAHGPQRIGRSRG